MCVCVHCCAELPEVNVSLQGWAHQQSADTSTLAQPVGPTPQAQPVDAVPQAQPVNAIPQAQPLDATPQTQPVDAMPQAQPVDVVPQAQPVDPTPLAQPVDANPPAQPGTDGEQRKCASRGHGTHFATGLAAVYSSTCPRLIIQHCACSKHPAVALRHMIRGSKAGQQTWLHTCHLSD